MSYETLICNIGDTLKDDKYVKVFLSKDEKFVYKFTRYDNSREYFLMNYAKSSYTISPTDYVPGKIWNCLIMPAYLCGDAVTLIENNEATEQNVKQIIYDIIQGLIFLKSIKVCHHDIKPENVLLIKDGKTLHGVLTDFGLSEILDNDESQGKCGGTRFYASPEILTGSTYSYSSDMWSVGICIAALLIGSFPYSGTASEIIEQQKLSTKILLPSDISSEAQDLLNKLLCYDPKQRLTAEEAIQHPWFHDVDTSLPL